MEGYHQRRGEILQPRAHLQLRVKSCNGLDLLFDLPCPRAGLHIKQGFPFKRFSKALQPDVQGYFHAWRCSCVLSRVIPVWISTKLQEAQEKTQLGHKAVPRSVSLAQADMQADSKLTTAFFPFSEGGALPGW